MKQNRKHQIGVSAVVIAAVGLLAGSAAYADIPGSDGVIHSCYRPNGVAQGELAVIDADVESCPTGYTALEWNSTAVGVPGYEVVTDTAQVGFTHTTLCSVGKVAISGGAKWNGIGSFPVTDFSLVSSYPTTAGDGWTVVYRRVTSTVDTYAICANG